MQKRIIFFTKAPTIGYGKSRLQGFLSAKAIYELTLRLITENFSAIKASGIPAVVYYAGEKENLSFLGNRYSDTPMEVQQGQGLGERMFNALQKELQTTNKVILIGSDLIGVTPELLHSAFAALDNTDIVLAPTRDGGYGIIGMKKPYDVFSGIPLSTNTVYEQTCGLVHRQGLSYTAVEMVRDIDTPEDLAALEANCDTVQLIGQGEYNINYRFNNSYILRINTASQLGLGDKQIEYEFQCLKALEHTGVTPKVYHYRLHGQYIPYGSLVMEYISGRPLNYDTDMETAAFLLATVHNAHVEQTAPFIRVEKPFQTMYEECCRMYAYYTAWEQKDSIVMGFVERFFEAVLSFGIDDPIEHACVINTELNNRNFIIGETKETSRIIDWEKPLLGECEQDIAHFLAPTTTHWKTEKILSEQEQETFLTTYEQYRPINRQKLRKYFLFNCLRGITWCSMAQIEYAQQRTVSNAETLERIREFLSYDFLQYLYNHFFEVKYV